MHTYEVDTRDVEYLRHAGAGLLARVYQPRGEGPFPAVLDIHGGAWTSYDRLMDVDIDRTLAATGIVVVAIDFRQPPVAGYPDSVADIHFGIRWLKIHANEFQSQASWVGGLGNSSGGHQLMLAALQPDKPCYGVLRLLAEHQVDARLRFVVLCWPILDPLARYHMAREQGRNELAQKHEAYFASVEAMVEGNPQLILERGEAAHLPPLLIVQGSNDANVTAGMADRFAHTYGSVGGTVQLEKFAGQPHGFINELPTEPASIRALELIQTFVHAQVAEAGQG